MLTAVLLASAPVAARADCPAALDRDLAAEVPECRFVAEGWLTFALGNGGVDCRLYR